MIRNAVANTMQNKNIVMFITAIIFMTGILVYFNDIAIISAFLLTILAVFLIIKNYIPTKYIIFWIVIFYFGFFNAYFRTANSDDLVQFARQNVTIQGQITSIPNSDGKGKTKFFFKADTLNGENIKGKTLITYTGNEELKIGNYYQAKGKLRTPFKASNPSQFDYGKYLKNFNTYTVFYTDEITPAAKNPTVKWKFLQNLNNLRDKIINVHSKYLKSPNLEILGGIVFGDDAIAPPDYIKASFINSGLLHILAASGMNVAFIYGFWVFFMRRIRAPFKITVLSGMILVIFYTMMTGMGASVLRAALMLLLILAGKLIDRDAHTISLLSFVATILLIYNPAYINDVGFQLSFIVTFGLLTTANIIFDKYKDSKIPDFLIGAILIPVVAQIWVAPIQMFYFNTFSTYSIFANILSMPFLSVISFGGFVSSIIAMFAPLTDKICMLFDLILNYVLNILVFISNFFAQLPHSLCTTRHPNIIQIFIYYGIILSITLGIKIGFNKKLKIFCLSLLTLLLISFIQIPSNNLEVIVFDVQNADCFLIKTPENKYFIIDTGKSGYKGSKAQANSIIIKYLKDRGIKNIEALIITHFDNDHSGGAVDIMKNLKVKQVYINSYNDKSTTSKIIYDALEKNQIPNKIPQNNSSIYKENDLNIQTYQAKTDKENDNSIITLFSYRNFDMLFMGDAGTKAFDQLKSDIPTNIEILKVGHHGGLNTVNKEMLDHIKTETSIISTGINSFGHPYKGTIDSLRETNIYRTDRHNSIKIKTNGDEYSIYTFNPKKKKYIKTQQSKTY